MKRKILFFVMMLTITALFTMQSCDKDEASLVETYGSFTDPVLLAPSDGGFVNVSGTTVELKWESTDSDGDAQSWDVYFGDSHDPDLYKSGQTAQSVTATVEPGTEYFWRVEAADAKGVVTRSPTWSFKVVDPAADMSVFMSWATDVKTLVGLDLDAVEAVDMRLLIVKASDKSIVGEEDGSDFEEYTDFNSLPDGDYLISADIYATIDAGDFNKPLNIDITLEFEQPGIQSLELSFPKVMTNGNACNLYRTNLAKVNKVGTVYTITKDITYMIPPVVTWNGTDATYPSEVTTTSSCTGKSMTGLGFGWMLDWWGEIIVSGGTLTYTTSGNTITIPLQKYCKTTYNGALQTEYYIQGNGTIDNTGAYPVYTIHYDFKQGSTWIGAYCFDNYGWEQDGFDAVITTDPAGKGSVVYNRPAKPNR